SLWRQGWDRVLVRSTSFLVGSSIAVLYASSRRRGERLIEQLKVVVERAPAAILTSDGMGCILSASDEVQELVGGDFRPLAGHSFSDVLMGGLPPGEAMHRYIEWFGRSGVHEQELTLRDHPEVKFKGKIVCNGEGRDRIMI